MTIEKISSYAQQASRGRAKVERISRSAVLITFTSTHLNSNKMASLVRLCGGRKSYDIRLIDGQLAIEVHLKKDFRLPTQYEQEIRRGVKVVEEMIAEEGKTIEEWIAEVEKTELPEIEPFPELNELSQPLTHTPAPIAREKGGEKASEH